MTNLDAAPRKLDLEKSGKPGRNSSSKAKFSEVIRKVRAGQRIMIAYRGEEIAEIRPLERSGRSLERSLPRLEDHGILSRARKPSGPLKPLTRKAGALARFLESRE